MHNLHLVRVYASDPQDACNTVENEIMEWGNENNWRTIGGCISEDGEIYIVDPSDTFGGSRYKPDNDTTIQSINEMINELMHYIHSLINSFIMELVNSLIN